MFLDALQTQEDSLQWLKSCQRACMCNISKDIRILLRQHSPSSLLELGLIAFKLREALVQNDAPILSIPLFSVLER